MNMHGNGGARDSRGLTEWVEEPKVRWGVTSPIYQSKILGEFPSPMTL
mgnify:CR=1|jgi:hypothetical protein